jgi:hypothetical protein
MWHWVFFEFWLIVLFVFSLGGHTDTYRTVAYGRGAFELCLPSLGILYQNNLLRNTILGRTPRLIWLWGEGPAVWADVDLQHYAVDALEVYANEPIDGDARRGHDYDV